MTTYADARQAVRHVLREISGYSPAQTDVLLDTLENFFAVLPGSPGSPPALPSIDRGTHARDGR